MGVIASDQITLIDLTDGYSVVLTNESHTFLGTTNSVSGTQVTTCMVQALCGSEQIPCSIGTLQLPTGLSIVSDGKVPVPTLTITATSALTKSGTIMIPVKIGDITISKAFSYSIAFRGTDGDDGTSVTVKSTSVTYQKSTSGTTTPTGTWLGSIPTVSAGEFLWTKTEVTYSDNNKTVAYSVSRNGSNGDDGTSVTITNTKIEYQKSSNGTTPPTGSWSTSIPTTAAGEWIWTRTTVTYSDGKSTVSYSVGRNGNNGTNGKDAIILNVISSGGQIFKNTDIATTLTAHVYKGGVELTGSALTSVGTVKWYKDGATTSMATGTTLTIQPGDVLVKASYEAKLEG